MTIYMLSLIDDETWHDSNQADWEAEMQLHTDFAAAVEAAGCQITLADGHSTRRIPLPLRFAFLADLESAQRASLAHGKWLVDQHLDHGLSLPGAEQARAA